MSTIPCSAWIQHDGLQSMAIEPDVVAVRGAGACHSFYHVFRDPINTVPGLSALTTVDGAVVEHGHEGCCNCKREMPIMSRLARGSTSY